MEVFDIRTPSEFKAFLVQSLQSFEQSIRADERKKVVESVPCEVFKECEGCKDLKHKGSTAKCGLFCGHNMHKREIQQWKEQQLTQ